MTTLISRIRITALLCSISFSSLSALAGETKDAGGGGAMENRIEIKDFAFNPQTLKVKSGEKITWVNRAEEPHTVVSVEEQFNKSSALNTDQASTSTAGAPGTYTYFCSVRRKMTATMLVQTYL